MDNYATMWEAVAAALPDHRALVRGDLRRDWAGFAERAARLAAALQSQGVRPGDRVGLALFNSIEYVEAAFAAFKLRAVPVNLNYRYREDELHYVLRDAGAELLLFAATLGERVAAVRSRLPGLRAVQVDDGSASPLLDGALDYEELVRAFEPLVPVVRSRDDPFVLYTGGTTGMPKGVVWRHGDLVAGLAEVYELAGVSPPSTVAGMAAQAKAFNAGGRSPVVLPTSPLIHGSAFFLAQTTLLLGGTVVLTRSRSFDPDEVWRLVEHERVTQLGIVGDVFAKPLLGALEGARERGRPYDISSLEKIASSGTMWTEPVKRALLEWGDLTLVDMLGSSEGGPFATSVADRRRTPGTAAFMLSRRAAVLRDDGSEIPPGTGEVGVLALGEPLPLRYHNDPSRTAATFRTFSGRRWAVLGDYARVGADRSVTFLGRGSVCINTGGEKVYPEEVEEAVKQHPAVIDCTVVGIPDERWGEAVTAVIAASPGMALGLDGLSAFLRDRLAGYKHPKHLVLVEAIHRSPVGKPSYDWARRVVLERLGRTAGPSATDPSATASPAG